MIHVRCYGVTLKNDIQLIELSPDKKTFHRSLHRMYIVPSIPLSMHYVITISFMNNSEESIVTIVQMFPP